MSDRTGRRHRGGGRTIASLAARLARLTAFRPAPRRFGHRADPHAHEFDFEHYVALARQRGKSSAQ